MNIVSIAMQFLTPMIVDRIASSLGLNRTLVEKGVQLILPTILAGIVGKAMAPGGGNILADVLGKQDPGALGRLGDVIGGSGQKALVEQGGNVLGDLLGGNAIGGLAGAVGKFAGIGEAPTKGLIGMLAPVALGTIASQQKAAGLDVGGLVNMLAGQKDNIAAAIPGDFAKMLGGTGLIDSIGPNLAKLASAAPAAPAPKAPAAPAQPAKSGGSWLPWLLALLVAAAAYWFLFAGPKRTAVLPTPPSITVGNANIGSQLGSVLGNLQTTLGGIKDAGSARNALGTLKTAQGDIDRIGGMMGQLSGDNKKALAKYVAAALPVLVPLINKLIGDSAIGPIVRPALDAMVSRLNTMAQG